MAPETLLPGRVTFKLRDDIDRLAENNVVNRATVGDDEAHWLLIPMSVQDETKARRMAGGWRGASEAHPRSGL